MADKTRFFCIAVAGATADGREISADWIEQMAADYNPTTRAARVNMEHVKGFSAEPPFNAYGDVLALEARDVTIQVGGKDEKRRGLFAQIDPTDSLVELNRARQKLYTSCEVHPNFAGTGRAYLLGLAVTDNPASLGTQMLEFAAGAGDANPLKSRKSDPAALFTATGDHVLDLTAETPAAPALTLGDQILALFTRPAVAAPASAPVTPAPAPATPPVTPPAANDNAAQFTAALGLVAGTLDKVTADLAGFKADFATLRTELAAQDASGEQRPRSTGTGGAIRTDC